MNSEIWNARAELSMAMKNKMPDYIVDRLGSKVQIEQSIVEIKRIKKQLQSDVAAAIMQKHNLK